MNESTVYRCSMTTQTADLLTLLLNSSSAQTFADNKRYPASKMLQSGGTKWNVNDIVCVLLKDEPKWRNNMGNFRSKKPRRSCSVKRRRR